MATMMREAPALLIYTEPAAGRAARFAVTNQKGGVGKTIIALGMAAVAARSGMRTLLVDADPQRSSETTSMAFDADPGYFWHAETEPAMLGRLEEVERNFGAELVIIDCPGSLQDDDQLAQIIRYADLHIVPYEHDVITLTSTLETLRYIHERGGTARVLINNFHHPGVGTDARATLNAVRLYENSPAGIPQFQATIRGRVAWRHSLRQGVPITDYAGPYAGECRSDIGTVLDEGLELVRRAG